MLDKSIVQYQFCLLQMLPMVAGRLMKFRHHLKRMFKHYSKQMNYLVNQPYQQLQQILVMVLQKMIPRRWPNNVRNFN